jgi:hypothetical protein
MSLKDSFWDWCRMPPEMPKNRHKKLLVGSLVCSVLGVSILVSSIAFYGGLMGGQTSALAVSSSILSVASLAEGPYYIQNVTYQQTAEANASTVPNYDLQMKIIQENKSRVLSFGGGDGYGNDTFASVNRTVINMGEQNLTVTSIEIYRGDHLFALIEGPLIVKAHTVGIINFQVYNLTELSKIHEQLITQSYQEGGNDEMIFGGRVMYRIVMKSEEGVTNTFEPFIIPTAEFLPGSS